VTRALAHGLLLVVMLSGCGGGTAAPDRLDGDSVARMAEQELEAENAGLAPGTLSCPDLDFRVGASVRCVRTTGLSGGRVVKVGGTVSVTTRASGGRLHVAMDQQAREFGLDGDEFVAGVRKRYRQRFGVDPSRLDCPYLHGEVGARVTCRVEAGGSRHDVDVVVTAVDAATYGTSYVLDGRRPG
jgi:hypothetical protein